MLLKPLSNTYLYIYASGEQRNVSDDNSQAGVRRTLHRRHTPIIILYISTRRNIPLVAESPVSYN